MDDKTWLRRIVITLLIGGLFRLFLLVGPLATMPQTEDGPSYRIQSLEILDGTASHFYFPPGTALCATPFYAVSRDSIHVDHFVATFFWVVFTVACSWLAWLVLEDKRAVWLASFLAAFLPHSILATTTISSQPLNAALITIVLCSCIILYKRFSKRLWLVACLCAGLAVITRPASAILIVILVGYLIVLHKRALISRMLAGGMLVLMLVIVACFVYPVMLHNNSCGQGMTISTNNEWNLLVGNNPYTPDYKTGHLGQRRIEQLPNNVQVYVRAILPRGEPSSATYYERQAMRDTALSYIKSNPERFIYRALNRLRAFWGMDYTAAREIQNTYHLSGLASILMLVFEGGGYLLVFVPALFALFFSLTSGWYRRVVYLVVGFSLLPYLVAFTVAKYHTAAMPLLFPLAASLIIGLHDGSISREFLKERSRYILFILLALVFFQLEHVFHIVDNM